MNERERAMKEKKNRRIKALLLFWRKGKLSG